MSDVTAAALEALAGELGRAAAEAGAPEDFRPQLERPADPAHGDLASNAALVLAGTLRRPPRQIAEAIAERLDRAAAGVRSVEVAGPGFLNFRLSDRVLYRGLLDLLDDPAGWGRSRVEPRLRINVEFVSANPTGPLHVAHGRGAAIGDAVASLLAWTGHDVHREFYVNDAGRQIERLAESIDVRWRQSRGESVELPEDGYHGGYVAELAERIATEAGEDTLAAVSAEERRSRFGARAVELLRAEQEEDLAAFGIRMDRWFEESSLFGAGEVEVDDVLRMLRGADYAYRRDGAVWLRSTELGDEKDRVLVKSDGSPTYLVSDIAYHLDKARRGFDRAIDVWGADHHGHIPRMRAGLAAAGHDPAFLEVLLIQLVTILRGGREVRMSKRAGRFVTLRELFEETGADVARYFFLMRRSEVPMTFDLDLALDTSEANPVYKVQYAHARMCSVFEKGGVDREAIRVTESELERLERPAEREVLKTVLRLPGRVRAAAEARAPYQVCQYLEELASVVNAWYHEGNLDADLRVLAEGPARPARLALARAVQVTLQAGLSVLGISAPEKMVRGEEP